MAGFCLPKASAEDFIKKLKDGTINPEKLIDMTSGERRVFFEKIVGEDSARGVNALFESKLLLKDQKRGLVSWAKKVSGITEEVRRDIIAKIDRMETALKAGDEEAFLEDLAAKKLGTDVSFEEAQQIVDGVKAVQEAKAKITDDMPLRSDERIEYGLKFSAFKDYVDGLKLRSDTLTWKEWITKPGEVFRSLAGTTKSILSSMDNSFFGRQGIKMLYTNPDIWTKNFVKSWGDIAKEVGGIDKNKSAMESLSRGINAMEAIRADVYSRPNAINGKYDKMKLDIGTTEEAFPSSFPEKIPLLGRLYNASQSAFTGGAYRMRADYADRLISKAEEFGVNMKDASQAESIGKLVNSMTGRGSIGKLNVIGGEVNTAIFSIKFLKSNLDTLSGHRAGFAFAEGPARAFARRQAAYNLAKVIAGTSAVLFTANQLWPGSVNFDPRSSDFGKIRIGKHTFDVTGGMGSITTLAARITPTIHKGKWGFWYQSKSGKWTDLTKGDFGQQDALDVIDNFWQGKLSPIAGVARDVWRGEDFNGNKPTPESVATGLVTPIPLQNAQQLREPDMGVALGLMILDGLGFSVNTDLPKK
jgi:hypothetical protein